MNKKLTLSMSEEDIRIARRLAREEGTTVSSMFKRLIHALDAMRRSKRGREKKMTQPTTEPGPEKRNHLDDLPPLTRQLTGILTLPEGKTDREVIEEAMLEKYGFEK